MLKVMHQMASLCSVQDTLDTKEPSHITISLDRSVYAPTQLILLYSREIRQVKQYDWLTYTVTVDCTCNFIMHGIYYPPFETPMNVGV